MDPWKLKYKTRNRGLNTTQIKCFGKQILMVRTYIHLSNGRYFSGVYRSVTT